MAKVYFTVDGGKTWHTEVIQDIDLHSPYDYALRHLKMPTRNTAYVISSGEWILKFNGDWTDVEDTRPPTEGIIISPNPATDYIEINLDRWTPLSKWNPSGSEIKIYNVYGELVISDVPHLEDVGHLIRIDVSDLPVGLYFVRVGGRMLKFVKL